MKKSRTPTVPAPHDPVVLTKEQLAEMTGGSHRNFGQNNVP
jgi:hypothetical protein